MQGEQRKQTLLPINDAARLESVTSSILWYKKKDHAEIKYIFTQNVEILRCYFLQSNNIMIHYRTPIHKNIIYNEIEIKSLLTSKLLSWEICKVIA